jgi:hypothetical protein
MATKKAATPASSSSKPKAAAKAPAKSAAKKAADTTSAATAKTAAPARKAPTRDEIARLAHRYWQERGSPHGSQHEDWLRAEAALKG